MNYMPEYTLYLLTSEKYDTLENITDHLKNTIPYAEVTLDNNLIHLSCIESYSCIEFLADREKKEILKKYPNLDKEYIQFLEVSSGPCDDYEYFQMFHDSELGLLQYPESYWCGRGGSKTGLMDTQNYFEGIAKELVSMILKPEKFKISYGNDFFTRIKEVFPDLFKEGSELSKYKNLLLTKDL